MFNITNILGNICALTPVFGFFWSDGRCFILQTQFHQNVATFVGIILQRYLLESQLAIKSNGGFQSGVAVGGVRNQFRGYAAVVDGWQSAFHPFPIVIQFLGRTRCWLEIAIVALRSKDAISVKSRHLELTVNIGGDNEV